MVVDKTVDELVVVQAEFEAASSSGEVNALYVKKRQLEDALEAAMDCINRVARGWVYMGPVGVGCAHGVRVPIAASGAGMPGNRREAERRPVTSGRGVQR